MQHETSAVARPAQGARGMIHNEIVAVLLPDGHIVRERRMYEFTGPVVRISVLKAKPV